MRQWRNWQTRWPCKPFPRRGVWVRAPLGAPLKIHSDQGSMMAGKNQMKDRLIRERDALLRQREALDNQIMGLERAISLVGGEETFAATKPGGRRTNTKGIVLQLLDEVGNLGLNAAIAVEMAHKRGVTLDRNSVSSLLSRLKSEGTLIFDSDRYKVVTAPVSRRTRAGEIIELLETRKAV